MIKRLIEDLANDNVTLTQALTRAKILAFQLDNLILQEWLKYELEGYEGKERILPGYRKISCEPKLRISDRWGRSKTLPMNFQNWPEFGELLSTREVVLGIPALEANYASLVGSDTGIVEFPAAMIQQLSDMLKLREQGLSIEQGGQQINKLQINTIIELTRQKLIDTLLQLNREFPNLSSDFQMSEENKDKAQNIITNNIYGSNNPLNLAAGQHVEQTGFNFSTTVNYAELERYGVETPDISALREIVEGNQKNKSTLQSKAMHWLAGVSAAVASKGLTEHLPAIVDFVQNLTR
jgi:hypothetical protein